MNSLNYTTQIPNTLNMTDSNQDSMTSRIVSSAEKKLSQTAYNSLNESWTTRDSTTENAVNTNTLSRHSRSLRSDLVSETSTLEFTQTPSESFRSQVEVLCHRLWSPSPQGNVTGVLLSAPHRRILSMLRATRVLKTATSAPLSPPPRKEFLIERLRGGGFNRIIGITVIDPESKAEDSTRLILRIGRGGYSRPDREVAMLRFVRQHTQIPVPDVKFMDLSDDNPLKSPYVIQDRVPGHNLQHAGPSCYPDLAMSRNAPLPRN